MPRAARGQEKNKKSIANSSQEKNIANRRREKRKEQSQKQARKNMANSSAKQTAKILIQEGSQPRYGEERNEDTEPRRHQRRSKRGS